MASKIYKAYTADEAGYKALVADITAATAWAEIDDGGTSTTFMTSHGGRLVAMYTGSAINVMCLRAGDGLTAFNKTDVVQVCFIKTAKVSAMFFDNSATANFITNRALVGFAISAGVNTHTGETYADLMTMLTTDNGNANSITNVDDTFSQAGLGTYTVTTVTGADATIAIGACSYRSACISDDVLTCVATPLTTKQECAVTVSGKKYYQARYFLFADE